MSRLATEAIMYSMNAMMLPYKAAMATDAPMITNITTSMLLDISVHMTGMLTPILGVGQVQEVT